MGGRRAESAGSLESHSRWPLVCPWSLVLMGSPLVRGAVKGPQ